ncbi:protease complex subunit PrcB family protein [Proteiniborus sp. MB09-C3]|uniref:protease complex subunit PrcB family protein n=1 Tax=Proteiniborus sp. MB09-C3 TaxID=3050072 RepID=UPI0025537186|nr:protease complex subunit PrcB family protein [Proteiniborus sp. MB09-C3]WIV12323.1 protease complex subunit PrcB family protein [Proteiniborus sp. MB09-C3]
MNMKKIIGLVLITVLGLSLFTACSTAKNTSAVIGDIDFEVVGSDVLTDSKLEEWYNENYKKEGIFSIDSKEHKYILVGAGEEPTGGYSVEITSVVGKEDSISVDAKVNAPTPEQMVTEAITYPNTLIRISKDSRKVEFGEFLKAVVEEDSEDTVEGTGIFVGLADSNSCEIKVDGEATPFRLSEEVKEAAGSLEMNQKVKFSYYLNEYEQMVITEIEIIED